MQCNSFPFLRLTRALSMIIEAWSGCTKRPVTGAKSTSTFMNYASGKTWRQPEKTEAVTNRFQDRRVERRDHCNKSFKWLSTTILGHQRWFHPNTNSRLYRRHLHQHQPLTIQRRHRRRNGWYFKPRWQHYEPLTHYTTTIIPKDELIKKNWLNEFILLKNKMARFEIMSYSLGKFGWSPVTN